MLPQLADAAAPQRAELPKPFASGDRERSLAVCEGMIDIAAALFNVSGKALRHPGRTRHDVARVRQIAMYVAHVALGLPQGEIGRGFVRDRTTVLHACQVIEDLRDDVEFDRIVAVTERVALAVFAGGARR